MHLLQFAQRGLIRFLRAAGTVVVEPDSQFLKGHPLIVRLADAVVTAKFNSLGLSTYSIYWGMVIGLPLWSFFYPAASADTSPAGWRGRRGRYPPVPPASKPSIPRFLFSSPAA